MSIAVQSTNISTMKTMIASIVLHALMAVLLLSKNVPVEVMPQQMIKVTMIAASADTVSKKKSETLSQVAVQPKKAAQSIKPPVLLKKSEHGMYKHTTKTVASTPPKEQVLAMLNPSAGSESNTQKAVQLTTPLFDATYLNNPAPEYPAQAKRRGIEGSVVLGVVVGKEGTAKSVIITESSGFVMLDNSAKNTVALWKFVPAKRGNETVEARVMIPIDFRLE